MSQADPTTTNAAFTWHPAYAGRSHTQVRAELEHEISRDQRSYALALDGAEHSEHDSLSTVVDVERRWSGYEFDWAEMDAGELADRVLAFEVERERRQELISFADYRAGGGLVDDASGTGGGLDTARVRQILIAVAVVFVIIIVLALTLG